MKQTIVAFLQNMVVRDPERVKASIARHGEEARMRYMELALFSGCVTGRRLEKAFGEELCQEIIWEETTREIAGDTKTIFPAQPDHIKAVLSQYKPTVVLAFGRIAAAAVRPLWNGALIIAPHPASRQADISDCLAGAAKALRGFNDPMTTTYCIDVRKPKFSWACAQ